MLDIFAAGMVVAAWAAVIVVGPFALKGILSDIWRDRNEVLVLILIANIKEGEV